jgi:hypothetical protein
MRAGILIEGFLVALVGLGLAACGGGSGSNVSGVPNVVGDTQSAANSAITAAGLTVGTVTTQTSSTIPSGDVILEDPAAGANVASGTAVGLLVSSGPPTPVVISGTVAAGTALTGTVSVYDSSTSAQPRSTGAAIGTGGQYSVTVTGFTAPFLLQATGQVGGQGPAVTLYSIATAGGTVNITPITTLIALNMSAGNLQSLTTGATGNLPSLTAADISDQNSNVDKLLSSVLAAEGLSSTYNFSATPFNTGSAGYDQLLDNVMINSTSATAVTVTNITAPTTPITIDTAKGNAGGALDITAGPTTLPAGTIGYVSVPNVVSDTQTAAATAITGAGLIVGTVTQAASATVATGDVISETPAAAAGVAKGSAVALVVSTGPQTYTIGGTLIGLGSGASVHVLNGSESLSVAANGSFTLATGAVSGGTYSVTVGTPTSAQTCAVQNGSGTIASANVTNVVVYCTFNVSTAAFANTYFEIGADFDLPSNGTSVVQDYVGQDTYTSAGDWNLTLTANDGGTITPDVQESGSYSVTTTNAIPSLGPGNGGIEGVNSDAAIWIGGLGGAKPPSIAINVIPNASATTDSVNGNYTQVSITGKPISGNVASELSNITLTNGILSGTTTINTGGTISTSTSTSSGQFTITGGILTFVDASLGAVSADGNLIVAADTTAGDAPQIFAAVPQATVATQSTFQGVYSIGEYGGYPDTVTFANVITLFAYGNGTYSVIFTKLSNSGVTTDNTDTGTYTVAANGVMTITDSEGDVYTGGVSADGNALVLASVAAQQQPAIFVGFRQ